MLKQAICETSRRGTDVKATPSNRTDAQRLKCIGEFDPSAGDKSLRAFNRYLSVAFHLMPWLYYAASICSD
jgi:hypothetical protein